MELADDIAYGIHDLEDAIVMNMVNEDSFQRDVVIPILEQDIPWLSNNIEVLGERLFSEFHHERKNAIGALVNTFITAITITEVPGFAHPLLRYAAQLPDSHAAALSLFKQFVYHKVIRKSEVQLLEYRGQQMVMELFEAFSSDPERLLPANTRKRWAAAERENNGQRIIADYISGMTDEFASRLYSTLFIPKHGGSHEPLQ